MKTALSESYSCEGSCLSRKLDFLLFGRDANDLNFHLCVRIVYVNNYYTIQLTTKLLPSL